MTRYVLLLVGGALVVFVSFFIGDGQPSDRFFSESASVTFEPDDPPDAFIPNLGNAPVDAFLYGRVGDTAILLKSRTIEFVPLDPSSDEPTATLYFVGSNIGSRITGVAPVSGSTGFGTVRFGDFYDGIDLVLSIDSGVMQVAMSMEPDVDPSDVQFRLDQPHRLVTQQPLAYQIIDGQRQPADVRFVESRFGSTVLEGGPVQPEAPVIVEFGIRP